MFEGGFSTLTALGSRAGLATALFVCGRPGRNKAALEAEAFAIMEKGAANRDTGDMLFALEVRL